MAVHELGFGLGILRLSFSCNCPRTIARPPAKMPGRQPAHVPENCRSPGQCTPRWCCAPRGQSARGAGRMADPVGHRQSKSERAAEINRQQSERSGVGDKQFCALPSLTAFQLDSVNHTVQRVLDRCRALRPSNWVRRRLCLVAPLPRLGNATNSFFPPTQLRLKFWPRALIAPALGSTPFGAGFFRACRQAHSGPPPRKNLVGTIGGSYAPIDGANPNRTDPGSCRPGPPSTNIAPGLMPGPGPRCGASFFDGDATRVPALCAFPPSTNRTAPNRGRRSKLSLVSPHAMVKQSNEQLLFVELLFSQSSVR